MPSIYHGPDQLSGGFLASSQCTMGAGVGKLKAVKVLNKYAPGLLELRNSEWCRHNFSMGFWLFDGVSTCRWSGPLVISHIPMCNTNHGGPSATQPVPCPLMHIVCIFMTLFASRQLRGDRIATIQKPCQYRSSLPAEDREGLKPELSFRRSDDATSYWHRWVLEGAAPNLLLLKVTTHPLAAWAEMTAFNIKYKLAPIFPFLIPHAPQSQARHAVVGRKTQLFGSCSCHFCLPPRSVGNMWPMCMG
ncbi:hypothetical protein VFPPC_17749 [Pochonia chlamydosporia 170]|uniref:Uncharacterized protein n=1 Tax=Pochonia chlamydosporia 170 TaxID=1380566 RepID=A0A219AS89_METCM|nr:hypothetical protein VFPPC_17749 [Pochonia chlamydosporia 170]OWT43075.1 hypothetical protein VFPPC_17749 [Pochonia chlamydosporia 170]